MSQTEFIPPSKVESRHRILLVEDDDGIRDAVTFLLEEEGFIVLPARNGLEAVDVVAESTTKPALIMLDLTMPVMDGWTFCKLRLGTKELMHIPVLAISAGPMIGDHEPIGATATLSKPFDPDELAWLATRLIQLR